MNEFPATQILTLHGSPRQRGRIHGETLRGKIKELIFRWKYWLVEENSIPSEQYIQGLVSETNFINAIERWTPDLLEEIKGIAEGAALDFETIFAFQLQDEEWWFRKDRKMVVQNQPRGCSSIGLGKSSTSPSIVAQNMDMPDYLDNYQVVFYIEDDRSVVESIIFSVCGLLALNGINNHSLGIVCNNLSQLNHSKNGLPVACVHRGVLEKKSFSEAKSFLKNIQHASGQNYLLGSPSRVVDVECSANQVAEYSSTSSGSSICHTNHPFVNTDVRGVRNIKSSSGNGQNEVVELGNIDSEIRFDVLSKQLGNSESSGDLNLIRTKRLLSSHHSETHPVCRHPKPGQKWMTIGTSIMCLEEHPQLHVCPGPPCNSSFTQFSFRK